MIKRVVLESALDPARELQALQWLLKLAREKQVKTAPAKKAA